MAAKVAAPAKAGAETSWTPFVKLLMGIGKDNKHDSGKSGVQTGGIFGSNGSTYYCNPEFAGTKLGADDEGKVVTIEKMPQPDELKKLWDGLQSALKDDRNNLFTSGGIHIGGRKFMFSKVLEVAGGGKDAAGKHVDYGTHKCIVGRCKSSSIILTPNAKSFTVIISAQNFNIGNIQTQLFVAHSLKKSGQ